MFRAFLGLRPALLFPVGLVTLAVEQQTGQFEAQAAAAAAAAAAARSLKTLRLIVG